VVLLNSLHRETPKNVIKKIDKKTVWDFLSIFWLKPFDTIFLYNAFCSVFELPSLRNTRKRDKAKKAEEKLTSKFCRFFSGKFSWGLFVKMFLMVFLNSPYRETPENVLKKKARGKKVGWWAWDLANARGGGPSIFLAGPSRLRRRNVTPPPIHTGVL
jgi:hypothetical protein